MKPRTTFPGLPWLPLRAQEKARQYKVRNTIDTAPGPAPRRVYPPEAWRAWCQNTADFPGSRDNRYGKNKSNPRPASGVLPRPEYGHQSQTQLRAAHAIYW